MSSRPRLPHDTAVCSGRSIPADPESANRLYQTSSHTFRLAQTAVRQATNAIGLLTKQVYRLNVTASSVARWSVEDCRDSEACDRLSGWRTDIKDIGARYWFERRPNARVQLRTSQTRAHAKHAQSLDRSSAATIVRPQCERTRELSIRYCGRSSKPRLGCRLSTK
jgi:hypothetical protein